MGTVLARYSTNNMLIQFSRVKWSHVETFSMAGGWFKLTG